MPAKCTRASDPEPVSGTSSVSASVPQSLVATRIRTGITSPWRLPTVTVLSERRVAVPAADSSMRAKRLSDRCAREAWSSSAYIWAKSVCSQAVT